MVCATWLKEADTVILKLSGDEKLILLSLLDSEISTTEGITDTQYTVDQLTYDYLKLLKLLKNRIDRGYDEVSL
jgi:hypothetical protein